MDKKFFIIIGVVLIILLFFARPLFTGNFVYPVVKTAYTCEHILWNHVWNSTRLTVISKCTSVTGTVLSSFQSNDADQHIQLLPDAEYKNLVNSKNIEFQLGSLVIEPICTHDPSIINNSTLLDAGIDLADGVIENASIHACERYISHVYIPKVGEHVKVTGAYVLDTLHGWMEIHPVTKIEVIK